MMELYLIIVFFFACCYLALLGMSLYTLVVDVSDGYIEPLTPGQIILGALAWTVFAPTVLVWPDYGVVGLLWVMTTLLGKQLPGKNFIDKWIWRW